jgi:hypothetical protein
MWRGGAGLVRLQQAGAYDGDSRSSREQRESSPRSIGAIGTRNVRKVCNTELPARRKIVTRARQGTCHARRTVTGSVARQYHYHHIGACMSSANRAICDNADLDMLLPKLLRLREGQEDEERKLAALRRRNEDLTTGDMLGV